MRTYRGALAGDDYLLAVGRGNVPGAKSIAISGLVIGLTQVEQVVASGFTTLYTYPSDAGEVLGVLSDSAADIGVAILVTGLDENFLEKREVVVTNGTAKVPLTGLWSRVNSAQVAQEPACAGTVSIEGATVYANILPQHQTAHTGVYTVPANYKYQILNVTSTMARDAGADTIVAVKLHVRPRPNGVHITAFALGLQKRGNTLVTIPNLAPEAFSGPADLAFIGVASNNNVDVQVRSNLLLTEKKL